MARHEHEWQVADKRITIKNEFYEGTPAYLRVRYCPKCKLLVGVDYWKEPIANAENNIQKG